MNLAAVRVLDQHSFWNVSCTLYTREIGETSVFWYDNDSSSGTGEDTLNFETATSYIEDTSSNIVCLLPQEDDDGYSYIFNTPWPVIAGGIPVILTTLGFTFLGESLRDVFDPKLRKEM